MTNGKRYDPLSFITDEIEAFAEIERVRPMLLPRWLHLDDREFEQNFPGVETVVLRHDAADRIMVAAMFTHLARLGRLYRIRCDCRAGRLDGRTTMVDHWIAKASTTGETYDFGPRLRDALMYACGIEPEEMDLDDEEASGE